MNNFSGIWDVVVHTFMGDQFSEHEYVVEGTTLNGIITDKGNGNKAEIKDGTINGSSISYKFTIKIPIGEMEFTMVGELKEDGKIAGNSSNAMGSFEYEAIKRV
jgi:hypothetical protein